MILSIYEIWNIVRHGLKYNDLVENITQPKAETEIVVVKPIAHQNDQVGSYIELISHQIQQETPRLDNIGPDLIHQSKVNVHSCQVASHEYRCSPLKSVAESKDSLCDDFAIICLDSKLYVVVSCLLALKKAWHGLLT